VALSIALAPPALEVLRALARSLFSLFVRRWLANLFSRFLCSRAAVSSDVSLSALGGRPRRRFGAGLGMEGFMF
jgi:hypothetical protein